MLCLRQIRTDRTNLPPRRYPVPLHPYRIRCKARTPSSSTAPRCPQSPGCSSFPCRGRRPAWSSASLRTFRTPPCSSSFRSGCRGFRCCIPLLCVGGTTQERRGLIQRMGRSVGCSPVQARIARPYTTLERNLPLLCCRCGTIGESTSLDQDLAPDASVALRCVSAKVRRAS